MMQERIEKLLDQLKEVEQQLGSPEILSDKKQYKKLTQQYSYLSELKQVWESYLSTQKALKENRTLVHVEEDLEMQAMIEEEIKSLQKKLDLYDVKIKTLLVPPDPRDNRNIIMEVRAGTGGDEAALFVGDCIRMYKLFFEKMGWKYETLSHSISDMGGFKEYVIGLNGKNVFRFMQYEAGTHRVQRVPNTETQGRVHTSAITVAILLEPDEEEDFHLDEKDLRIETYRASGAGGQHVNTTDSAVRITHIPSNTVVCCQDERSQIKNKDKALRMLRAKVAEEIRREQHEKRSKLRSGQIGSGDRSGRVRTYNFPQNRLTDHRIDLTLYKLDQIMQGELDEIVNALVSHFYQERLHSTES